MAPGPLLHLPGAQRCISPMPLPSPRLLRPPSSTSERPGFSSVTSAEGRGAWRRGRLRELDSAGRRRYRLGLRGAPGLSGRWGGAHVCLSPRPCSLSPAGSSPRRPVTAGSPPDGHGNWQPLPPAFSGPGTVLRSLTHSPLRAGAEVTRTLQMRRPRHLLASPHPTSMSQSPSSEWAPSQLGSGAPWCVPLGPAHRTALRQGSCRESSGKGTEGLEPWKAGADQGQRGGRGNNG